MSQSRPPCCSPPTVRRLEASRRRLPRARPWAGAGCGREARRQAAGQRPAIRPTCPRSCGWPPGGLPPRCPRRGGRFGSSWAPPRGAPLPRPCPATGAPRRSVRGHNRLPTGRCLRRCAPWTWGRRRPPTQASLPWIGRCRQPPSSRWPIRWWREVAWRRWRSVLVVVLALVTEQGEHGLVVHHLGRELGRLADLRREECAM